MRMARGVCAGRAASVGGRGVSVGSKSIVEEYVHEWRGVYRQVGGSQYCKAMRKAMPLRLRLSRLGCFVQLTCRPRRAEAVQDANMPDM